MLVTNSSTIYVYSPQSLLHPGSPLFSRMRFPRHISTPIVNGKKKVVAMAKKPNAKLAPDFFSMGCTKNGAVYETRFRKRLNTRLASAPCRG